MAKMATNSPSRESEGLRNHMAKLCEVCLASPRFGELFKDTEGMVARSKKQVKKSKTLETPRVFGLDCEMIITTDEQGNNRTYSLARASLVELIAPDNVAVVFNVFVKQDEASKVHDYLEHVSGITERDLLEAKHTLQDVAQLLNDHVQELDIIVGHTLPSDFAALKWSHPRVIDTSIFFSVTGAPRFTLALKDLVSYVSGEDIHTGESAHDPVLDAKYALQVAVYLSRRLPKPHVELDDVPDRYRCLISLFNFPVIDEETINNDVTALAESLNGELSKPVKITGDKEQYKLGKAVLSFPTPDAAMAAFSTLQANEKKNSKYGYYCAHGFRRKYILLPKLGEMSDVECEISTYSRPNLGVTESLRLSKDCIGRIMGVKGVRILHIRKMCCVDITNFAKDKFVEILVRGETSSSVENAINLIKLAAKGNTLGV